MSSCKCVTKGALNFLSGGLITEEKDMKDRKVCSNEINSELKMTLHEITPASESEIKKTTLPTESEKESEENSYK